MKETKQELQETNASVLGKIVAAQNILFVLPTKKHIAEFYAKLLSSIPGISSCCVCFGNAFSQEGEFNSEACSECENRQRKENATIPKEFTCKLNGLPSIYIVTLDTLDCHFGFFIFSIDQPELFKLYSPFISNMGNFVALSLENRLQKNELQKSNDWLENRVKERTEELQSLNTSLEEEIEERKHTAESLTIREQQYRTLLENIPALIVRYNTEMQRIYVNSAWEKASGLSGSEVVNVSAADIPKISNPVNAEYLEKLQKAIETGIPQTIEFNWVNAHGINLFLEYSIIPEYDRAGKIVSVLAVGHDLTDRKQAEEKLLKSEKEFRTLAENSPDVIVRYDREGRRIYVNPEFERVNRLTAKEVYGMKPVELSTELAPRANEFTEKLLTAMASGTITKIDLTWNKDGKQICWFVRIMPEFDTDGKVISALTIWSDITERKQTELFLKEKNDEYLALNEELTLRNNEYYALNEEYITINRELENSNVYNRMLFDLSTLGLALAKITGELVDVNQAYADIINYTIEETLKLTYWDITPKKYTELEQIQLNNLNEKGFYGPYEKEYINKSGKLISVRLSGRIIEKNGEKFIWSSVENITIQKQFEEEIKQNEFRLNTLFELSNQKTLPLNEIYNFVLNKSIELCKSKIGFLGFVDETEENVEIFSWSDSVMSECTVQNRTLHFVVSKSGLWAEAIRQRKPIIRNDYNAPNQFKKGFPSGHVKINNFACFPFFENEKIVTIVALANKETDYNNTDIIQLDLLLDGMWTIIKERNYQSDLVSAKEKAEESDKLKSSFLQNMSHEIRTPLNAITGFSELMTMPNQKPEKLKKFSEMILIGTERLIGIITDIIEISEVQANLIQPKLTEIEIISFLNRTVLNFAEKAKEKNIELILKIDIPIHEYFICSDKGKLERIFFHLIDNAIKFTHQGSVEIVCELKQENIKFSITDTGIGIAAEMQKIIFEPFRQIETGISRNFGGNGLGLSLTKAYTELLKGSISLKSQINKGTTFIVTIPENKESIQTNEILVYTKNYSINTILIAEDEYNNYQYLLELLNETKLKILYAENGQEALDLCRNNSSIDLILMDIKMPIMDGHTAAKLIKGFRPDIPIIAQTAYALESEKEMFVSVFDDYITKPIRGNELKQKLLKYI